MLLHRRVKSYLSEAHIRAGRTKEKTEVQASNSARWNQFRDSCDLPRAALIQRIAFIKSAQTQECEPPRKADPLPIETLNSRSKYNDPIAGHLGVYKVAYVVHLETLAPTLVSQCRGQTKRCTETIILHRGATELGIL